MRKKLLSLILSVCLIMPCLLFTGCSNNPATSTMQMSVNPSVTFVLGANDKVLSVSYENADAGTLYSDVNFVGQDVEAVIQIFIERGAISNHIALGNSVVEISVTGISEAEITALKNKAKAKVEAVFESLGAEVQVQLDTLSAVARKTTLINKAKALAPEVTEIELNDMTVEQLTALINDKQKLFEGLAYTQIQTIKEELYDVNNLILQAIETLNEQLEAIDNTIQDIQAQVEQWGNLIPDQIKNQLNTALANFNAKKSEIKNKANEFVAAVQNRINAAKAYAAEAKQNLANAFNTQVETYKTQFVAHLEAAKDSGKITQKQYDYWYNLANQ